MQRLSRCVAVPYSYFADKDRFNPCQTRTPFPSGRRGLLRALPPNVNDFFVHPAHSSRSSAQTLKIKWLISRQFRQATAVSRPRSPPPEGPCAPPPHKVSPETGCPGGSRQPSGFALSVPLRACLIRTPCPYAKRPGAACGRSRASKRGAGPQNSRCL